MNFKEFLNTIKKELNTKLIKIEYEEFTFDNGMIIIPSELADEIKYVQIFSIPSKDLQILKEKYDISEFDGEIQLEEKVSEYIRNSIYDVVY